MCVRFSHVPLSFLDHLKDFYKNLYCESRKIHLHTRILPNIVKTCECELGSNNNDPLQNDLILGLSGDNYQSFHEWIKLEEKIGDVFDYGDLLSYFKNRNTLINTINDWIYASLVFLRSDGNFQKCWNSDKLKKKEKNQLHKEVLSFIRSENSLVNHRYVWSCLNEKRGVFTTPELVFSILCELCIIYPSRIKRYPENDLFYSSH